MTPKILLIALATFGAWTTSACAPSHSAATADGGPDAPTGANLADAGGAGSRSSDASTADGAGDTGVGDVGVGDAGASALHVLFIGDSYTYVNDLPGMLTKIAATAGVPPIITTDEVVQGGATLQVQWSNQTAQTKILQGGWTHVVVQGQSEEPLQAVGDPGSFSDYAEEFDDLIAQVGARPTLFSTWARAAGDPVYAPLPSGSYVCPAQMQDELTIAYEAVAKLQPRSILVCAGEAFQRAIAQYPAIVLQQSDRSHPTVAGTYLAASTFYVALTGNPVPAASEVPAGLSMEDAAHLRDIALLGSDCADVKLKGAIASTLPETIDAGSPFDFGTAGTPISTPIELMNTGGQAVGISDGMTLAPPFEWTAGGAYPGGSGAAFCGATLSPGDSCTLSVTYTGATSATGVLTLDFSSGYLPRATSALRGSATPRALLTVSDGPGFFACTGVCAPAPFGASPGGGATLDLFVINRGAAAVTALAEGTPLAAPFGWAGGALPGGVGSVTVGSPAVTYPYCTPATLGPGEQCVVTVAFSPMGVGMFNGTVNLAYSDAMGPVTPNTSRNISGDSSEPLPP